MASKEQDVAKGYTPLIMRKWDTLDITPQQLVQLLRNSSAVPEDARYSSILFVGNTIKLTYESDEHPYCVWEDRGKHQLNMLLDDNLDRVEHDMWSSWMEVEEVEDKYD